MTAGYHPRVDQPISFAFRGARAADAPAIAEVARRTWRATYRGLIPDAAIESHLATAYADERVVARIERADRFDVAEEADGDVVGFAEWVAGERVAELVATYILPSCQRRGIGRGFHQRALDAFRGRVDAFQTDVLAANLGGRRFYESVGYRPSGGATFVLAGATIEEVRYRLDLPRGNAGVADDLTRRRRYHPGS